MRAASNTFKLFQLSVLIGSIGGLLKFSFGNPYFLIVSDLLLWFIIIFYSPSRNRTLEKRKNWKENFLTKTIIVLFIISILQIFNPNVNNTVFSFQCLRVSSYILIFIFVGIKFYTQEIEILAFFEKFLPYVIIFSSSFAIFEFLFPQLPLFNSLIKKEFDYGGNNWFFNIRVCGLFVGPMQLSLFTGLLFLLISAKIKFTKLTFFNLILLIYSLLILILSKSRAVLFSTLFIAILFFLLSGRKKILVTTIQTLIGLSIVFIIVYYLMQTYFDKESISFISERYIYSFQSNNVNGSSFQGGRIDRWVDVVFPLIVSHPWGLGTGFTNSFFDQLLSNYVIRPILTESIFFDVFVEQGIIAGILFFLIMVIAVKLALQAFREKDLINIYCGYVVLLFIIPGITSPNLSAFPFTHIFSVCLGILLLRSSHTKAKIPTY